MKTKELLEQIWDSPGKVSEFSEKKNLILWS